MEATQRHTHARILTRPLGALAVRVLSPTALTPAAAGVLTSIISISTGEDCPLATL